MFKVFNQLKKHFYKQFFEFQKIFSIIWPFDWSKIQKQELVLDALKNVGRNFKIVFGVALFCFVLSGFLLLQSFYYLITVKTPNLGGTLFEAAIEESSIKHLSPVLTSTSPTQKKIISLMYEPLYKVIYPDFATANIDQKIQIKPILLESEPIIQDSPSGKILKMKLKTDIKWSNGTEIVADDILYTFDKLKEAKGNTDYKDVLANYRMIVTDPKTFEIQPIDKNKQNPQILYFANFSPISRLYYANGTLDDIENKSTTLTPEVVSGQFKIPKKIKYLSKEVDNIYKDENKNILYVLIENSGLKNSTPSNIQNYVFTLFGDLLTTNGRTDSVEKEIKTSRQVDLLIRDIDNSNDLKTKTPDIIKSKLNLEQTLIPTNEYVSAFANVQTNQWLVNQQLRKYIFCGFGEINEFEQDRIFKEIPEPKKYNPIQLAQDFVPSCSNSRQELVDIPNKSGKYSYENNIISYNSQPINLSILTTEPLLNSVAIIQNKLKAIGITSSIDIAGDLNSLKTKIDAKDYNLAILPTTVVSRDIYSLYGEKNQDLLGLTKNNRIGKNDTNYGQGVETLLKSYSDSNLTDKNAYNELVNTFNSEFLVFNFYQTQKELNYSKKIQFQTKKDTNVNLPNFGINNITFPVDVYNNYEYWYIDTKDKLFFL